MIQAATIIGTGLATTCLILASSSYIPVAYLALLAILCLVVLLIVLVIILYHNNKTETVNKPIYKTKDISEYRPHNHIWGRYPLYLQRPVAGCHSCFTPYRGNVYVFPCLVKGCNATTHVACPHTVPSSPYGPKAKL